MKVNGNEIKIVLNAKEDQKVGLKLRINKQPSDGSVKSITQL